MSTLYYFNVITQIDYENMKKERGWILEGQPVTDETIKNTEKKYNHLVGTNENDQFILRSTYYKPNDVIEIKKTYLDRTHVLIIWENKERLHPNDFFVKTTMNDLKRVKQSIDIYPKKEPFNHKRNFDGNKWRKYRRGVRRKNNVNPIKNAKTINHKIKDAINDLDVVPVKKMNVTNKGVVSQQDYYKVYEKNDYQRSWKKFRKKQYKKGLNKRTWLNDTEQYENRYEELIKQNRE